MLRDAHSPDLPALRTLFAKANDAPYDLAAVAEEKCFGAGVAGAPRVRVFEREGQIDGAAVTCGRFLRILAVDREARRQGIGSVLLEDSGATVIAAEAGNYFTPGVVTTDQGSRAFFQARGFDEKEPTANLEVRLATPRQQTPDNRQPISILRASPSLLPFIEREFGRIWRFEAAKAFEREVPTAFVAMDGDAIAGFAVHDVNNRGLGFFGPTGVTKAMRGRGYGCALLRASLGDLHALGYARAVIPWTDALDFYRKCGGAEPAHRFVAFARARP